MPIMSRCSSSQTVLRTPLPSRRFLDLSDQREGREVGSSAREHREKGGAGGGRTAERGLGAPGSPLYNMYWFGELRPPPERVKEMQRKQRGER